MIFFPKKQFAYVSQCLQQNQEQKAIECMKKWHAVHLAYLQEQFPECVPGLRQDAFNAFWQAQRQKLILPKQEAFSFQQHETISDADFVTGYLFYLVSLRYLKNKNHKQFQHYLTKAIEYQSIHGLQKWLHEFIMQPVEDKSEYLITLTGNLFEFEKLIRTQLTPGYLLLAKGYLHAALIAGSADEPDKRKIAYALTWKYLHLAQLVEPYAKASIHNAYFGQGLANSNAFQVKSIDKMKAECLKLAGDVLNLEQQNHLEKEARAEFASHHQPGSEQKASVSQSKR